MTAADPLNEDRSRALTAEQRRRFRIANMVRKHAGMQRISDAIGPFSEKRRNAGVLPRLPLPKIPKWVQPAVRQKTQRTQLTQRAKSHVEKAPTQTHSSMRFVGIVLLSLCFNKQTPVKEMDSQNPNATIQR